MRICLVGNFVPGADEGVRRLASCLAAELSRKHDVARLHMKDISSWKRVRDFRPQIIHFLLSPTTPGFIAAKVLTSCCPGARAVLSAPQASLLVAKWLLARFKPDLVLAQSCESEQMFRSMGCRTQFLPNGVDTDKYVPASLGDKLRLRQTHNIVDDSFVVLHVGPVKGGRNLHLLAEMQGENNQVIIVGRPSEPGKTRLCRELEQRGCIIWKDYIENMEQVYALSDCYVFPTLNPKNCIELPFSVLEAMSCNLPVVTTRFGALPRVFTEGGGLFFADNSEDFRQRVENISQDKAAIATRDKVLPYSWQRITEELEGIYQTLLS